LDELKDQIFYPGYFERAPISSFDARMTEYGAARQRTPL